MGLASPGSTPPTGVITFVVTNEPESIVHTVVHSGDTPVALDKCVTTCTHQNSVHKSYVALKVLCSVCPTLSPTLIPATTHLFPVSRVCLLQRTLGFQLTLPVAFADWPRSLGQRIEVSCMSFHGYGSWFCAECYPTVWMVGSSFTRSPAQGRFAGFYVSALARAGFCGDTRFPRLGGESEERDSWRVW